MSASLKPIPILDLSPEITELWNELNVAIQRVLVTGDFIMGKDVKAFEQEAARYLGVKHAVAVNSGTDALIISLRALGIGPGDEVITTPFSFFATAEAISNVGAKPVFADVEAASFNISPQKIEERITPATKAILPVHLYGNPAAMTQIMAIAKRHHLRVIEDCAQSFGAYYSGSCSGCDGQCQDPDTLKGKRVGSIGDMGAFSFYPTKNLGAYGDGGLIVTDDDGLAETAAMLRVHGSKKRYHNELLGYASRLDSLQAAILRVKLPHLEDWNIARRKAAAFYNELLADVPGVITPQLADGHVFHQYTLRLIGVNRDAVQELLGREGISTMVYYPIPQDRLPVYKGQYPPNPVSDSLANEVISLPLWPTIARDVQETVITALLRCLTSQPREDEQ